MNCASSDKAIETMVAKMFYSKVAKTRHTSDDFQILHTLAKRFDTVQAVLPLTHLAPVKVDEANEVSKSLEEGCARMQVAWIVFAQIIASYLDQSFACNQQRIRLPQSQQRNCAVVDFDSGQSFHCKVAGQLEHSRDCVLIVQ